MAANSLLLCSLFSMFSVVSTHTTREAKLEPRGTLFNDHWAEKKKKKFQNEFKFLKKTSTLLFRCSLCEEEEKEAFSEKCKTLHQRLTPDGTIEWVHQWSHKWSPSSRSSVVVSTLRRNSGKQSKAKVCIDLSLPCQACVRMALQVRSSPCLWVIDTVFQIWWVDVAL